MRKRIGVVIPTYNRSENLNILLGCLNKQSTKDFNVVVADDGSTDDTKEMVDKLSKNETWKGRLTRVDCGPNKRGRRGRARNIGVQRLPDDTSLIVMLDSDLILEPDLISNYRSINNANPNRVIFGMIEWLPPASVEIVKDYKETTDDHEVKSEWSLFTNTAVPIDLFKKLGGFDENMEGYGYEDMELGARMSKAGARCIYASNCLALHMWHLKKDDKLCSIENQVNLDYFLKKHGSNPYYENLVDWRYWWHYHKQRGGVLHLVEDRLWVINSHKTKMLSLPNEDWMKKLGFTKNDELTGKMDITQIENVGEAFDPMEFKNSYK